MTRPNPFSAMRPYPMRQNSVKLGNTLYKQKKNPVKLGNSRPDLRYGTSVATHTHTHKTILRVDSAINVEPRVKMIRPQRFMWPPPLPTAAILDAVKRSLSLLYRRHTHTHRCVPLLYLSLTAKKSQKKKKKKKKGGHPNKKKGNQYQIRMGNQASGLPPLHSSSDNNNNSNNSNNNNENEGAR